MTGTFAMPNIVFDDPYFTKEERSFSRVEAVAWIAKHVRWSDNCVLRRGQGTWSLSYLATAWGWHVSKVRRFLKKLESANVIRTARDIASDTAQTIITYLFSTGYKGDKVDADTGPTVERHSSDTKTKSGNTGKEDSPVSPQGDDGQEDFGPTAGWAGGAGSPKQDVPPKPDDPTPNSAAPPPRKAARKAQVPVDWYPSHSTVEWAEIKLKATSAQINDQLDAFRDHHISKGTTFADFNRAFQTWMRNAKRYGHLDPAKPKYKTRAEEFSI